MTENSVPEEVLVVRFFETGPLLKAAAVFNIVRDKMQERLRDPSREPPPDATLRRRQRQKVDDRQRSQPRQVRKAVRDEQAVTVRDGIGVECRLPEEQT